jgi:hypothetical protein
MNGYYAFMSLDMVVPDQADALRKSQDGVVGWRYRPEKRILDLLFETDIRDEQARLDAIASGQSVYLVLDGQRSIYHLPTHLSILEEIADEVDDLVANATGVDEHSFNSSEYIVPAEHIVSLNALLQKLVKFDEAQS